MGLDMGGLDMGLDIGLDMGLDMGLDDMGSQYE